MKRERKRERERGLAKVDDNFPVTSSGGLELFNIFSRHLDPRLNRSEPFDLGTELYDVEIRNHSHP